MRMQIYSLGTALTVSESYISARFTMDVEGVIHHTMTAVQWRGALRRKSWKLMYKPDEGFPYCASISTKHLVVPRIIEEDPVVTEAYV
jgi:hypothetical protein